MLRGNVPNLNSGDVVEISQWDVFDYIRLYPDNRKEGNSTSEILDQLNINKGKKTSAVPAPVIPTCGE